MKCPKCDNAKDDRFMGCEISSIYDGVCYWTCLECGHRWNRFNRGDRRYERVREVLMHDVALTRKAPP